MTPEARLLHEAFIDAFPGYLKARVVALAFPEVDGAVVDATAMLERDLDALLALPEQDQIRSPLQLVREATAPVTAALVAAGAEPVERDEEQRSLVPGDVFALAPASSRDLGEGAWRAHVDWGVAKARSVAGVVPAAGPDGPSARPRVGLVSMNLMDRTRLESVADTAGFDLQVLRNPAAVADALDHPPAVAWVDLEHAEADSAIRDLTGAGVRVVAFGPHVDDVALVRAKTLGAVEAVARSRFFADPGRTLPRLV